MPTITASIDGSAVKAQSLAGNRRLQPLRYLHDCSDCFRLERSPGGACTHWKAPPFHGAPPKRDVGRAADSGSRFGTRRPDPPCGAICYSAVEVVRALAELGLVQSQCGPLRFEASSLFGNRAVGKNLFYFLSRPRSSSWDHSLSFSRRRRRTQ